MEISEQSLKEQVETYKKLLKNLKEFNELQRKLYEYRKENRQFRNVSEDLLNHIYSKYEYNSILNCYGDIFFITIRDVHSYVGRRVLWNLELSEEEYEIEEIVERDSEGAFDSYDYKITLKK